MLKSGKGQTSHLSTEKGEFGSRVPSWDHKPPHVPGFDLDQSLKVCRNIQDWSNHLFGESFPTSKSSEKYIDMKPHKKPLFSECEHPILITSAVIYQLIEKEIEFLR